MHVRAVATVNADGFTVHADGEWGTQHRHEVANVGRSDDVLDHGALVGGLVERLDGRTLALCLLGVTLKRGLRDRLPGVDGVDVDAVGPECVGHRLGQVDSANVADAATHRDARRAPGAAADVDHTSPASLLQVRHGRLDRTQVAHHLLFEVAQDIRVAHGLDGAWRATDTGRVVDHDVDAPELARRRVDKVLDRISIRSVADDRDDLAARLVRQLSGRLLQRSFGTGANSDVAALERKLASDSPTDAAAGAGDDGFLVGELQVHLFLLRA